MKKYWMIEKKVTAEVKPGEETLVQDWWRNPEMHPNLEAALKYFIENDCENGMIDVIDGNVIRGIIYNDSNQWDGDTKDIEEWRIGKRSGIVTNIYGKFFFINEDEMHKGDLEKVKIRIPKLAEKE